MRTAGIAFGALALMLAGAAAAARAQTSPADERAFSGSWSAIGRRQTVPTEEARPAAIVQLSGTVVLTTPAGLSRAFQAVAIGFDDGAQIAAGRAAWTDSRGDRVFSVMKGEPLATGRRVAGTITGGTGRYAGATGDWEMTWQFVVETEDGDMQGRAPDLHGRIRGVRGTAPGTQGPRP